MKICKVCDKRIPAERPSWAVTCSDACGYVNMRRNSAKSTRAYKDRLKFAYLQHRREEIEKMEARQ